MDNEAKSLISVSPKEAEQLLDLDKKDLRHYHLKYFSKNSRYCGNFRTLALQISNYVLQEAQVQS